jgi:hypothetical protein
MRLLVIPTLTKQAAASPFHGYFVSPGSKRVFLLALRTMLTIGVSPMWIRRSVTAVTGVCDLFPHDADAANEPSLSPQLLFNLDQGSSPCRFDKPRRSLENRRFSSLQRKAFLCQYS